MTKRSQRNALSGRGASSGWPHHYARFDPVIQGIQALRESRWKNFIIAAAFGMPLIYFCALMDDSGFVTGLAPNIAATVAVTLATPLRERLLLLYSIVSVLCLLVTGYLLSIAVASYTSVRKRRYWVSMALVVIPVVFAYVAPAKMAFHTEVTLVTVNFSFVFSIMPILLACLVNAVESMAALEAERMDQKSLLRESMLREAAFYQRERLVRKIHNGVGSKITIMVLQAGAIEVRNEVSEPVKERCRSIIAAGSEAISSLREIIMTAKSPDGGKGNTAEEAGRSISGGIQPLVEMYRASGQKVGVDVRLEASGPNQAAQELACRVVEEGLSNTLRYAPGAPVKISISQSDDILTVIVENGKPGSIRRFTAWGTGHGLDWLRREVEAVGGEFRAVANEDGGFVLRTSFPAGALESEQGEKLPGTSS